MECLNESLIKTKPPFVFIADSLAVPLLTKKITAFPGYPTKLSTRGPVPPEDKFIDSGNLLVWCSITVTLDKRYKSICQWSNCWYQKRVSVNDPVKVVVVLIAKAKRRTEASLKVFSWKNWFCLARFEKVSTGVCARFSILATVILISSIAIHRAYDKHSTIQWLTLGLLGIIKKLGLALINRRLTSFFGSRSSDVERSRIQGYQRKRSQRVY